MRRTALICSLLLSLAGSSFAAAAEELPNYATQPAVVSTSPAQPAEPTEAESSIDASAADSTISTVPATPKQEEAVATEQQQQKLQTLQPRLPLSATSLCRLQINPSLNQS